jgi:hypothetical protein
MKMRVLFVIIAFLQTFAFNSYCADLSNKSKNMSYSVASKAVENDTTLSNLIAKLRYLETVYDRQKQILEKSFDIQEDTKMEFSLRRLTIDLKVQILDLKIATIDFSTQDDISDIVNEGRKIQYEYDKIKVDIKLENNNRVINQEAMLDENFILLQNKISDLNKQIKKLENDYFENKKFLNFENYSFTDKTFKHRVFELRAEEQKSTNTFICNGITNKLVKKNPQYKNLFKNAIILMDYKYVPSRIFSNYKILPNYKVKYLQILKVNKEDENQLIQLTEDSLTVLLDVHIKTALQLDISVNLLKTVILIDTSEKSQLKSFTYYDLLSDLKTILKLTKMTSEQYKSELDYESSSKEIVNSKDLAFKNSDNRPVTDTYNISHINSPSKTFSENYVKLSEDYIRQIIKNLSLSNKNASFKIYDTNPFQVKLSNIRGFVTPKYWESVWIVSQQGDIVSNQENTNNRSISIYNTMEGNYLKTLTLYPPNESEFNVAPNIKNDFPDDAKRVLNMYKEYIIKNIKK